MRCYWPWRSRLSSSRRNSWWKLVKVVIGWFIQVLNRNMVCSLAGLSNINGSDTTLPWFWNRSNGSNWSSWHHVIYGIGSRMCNCLYHGTSSLNCLTSNTNSNKWKVLIEIRYLWKCIHPLGRIRCFIFLIRLLKCIIHSSSSRW